MEVKPGYQKTEVGIIPDDWKVIALGENCDLITKGTTPTSIGKDFAKIGIKFLKAESIAENGKTIPDKIAYIDNATNKLLRRSQLIADDLLISIAGVLGRVGLVESADLLANINQALAIVRLGKSSKVERCFLFFLLRSSVIANQISNINVQAAQANISLQNVRDFLIPFPPTKIEQEAIAEALSDADALIESLEQLIAKKRQVKQGAMQDLITGKRRLPGFSTKFGYKNTNVGMIPDDWEIAALCEVVIKFVNGGTPSTRLKGYWTGNIPWITGNDIHDQKVSDIRRFITIEAVKNSSTNVIEKGNLLLVSRTGVGKLAIAPYDIAISQDFTGIYTNREKLNPEYLFRFLDLNRSMLIGNNQGTSIMGITRETLSTLNIFFPTTLAEQLAIIKVLNDMNAEIVALEEKLIKARQVKQGMMQELLTGRIRLV